MNSQWKRLCLLFGALALVAHSQDAAEVAEHVTEEGVLSEEAEGEESFKEGEGIAQEALTSEQMRALHSKIDADKDGKLSMAELIDYSVLMRKMAAKKDIHSLMEEAELPGEKDGKLSLAEFLKDFDDNAEEDKAQVAERKEVEMKKFKTADQDGDGMLNTEELQSLFFPETHDGMLTLTAQAALKSRDTNGDGVLSSKEFWEGDPEDNAISEEEQADFAKLDKDKSGTLNLSELKAWESGGFHTEEAMKQLFELADKDKDMHVTFAELDAARELIVGSEAHFHLIEWNDDTVEL